MRLGPSITLSASAVTALSLITYLAVQVTSRDQERRQDLRESLRATATAIRTILEVTDPFATHDRARLISETLSNLATGTRVDVLPRSTFVVAAGVPTPALRLDTWTFGIHAEVLGNAVPLLDAPDEAYEGVVAGRAVAMLPIRVRLANQTTGTAGVVMISRELRALANLRAADWRQLLLQATLVWLVITTLVAVLVRSLVSTPMVQLLTGIEAVAGGDLTQALLASRDDEVGQLATRFNEMTLSLRQSNEQSKAQSEARLAIEQRLGHTERLATLGQLAAEIAHEVGTPLNVISARAHAMGRRADDVLAVQKNARIIAEQSDRIARIIERLLAFTRREATNEQPRPVDINEIALTTMELIAGNLRARQVRSRLIRADDLPRVLGHTDRLQQVALNLVMNAVQSVAEGGFVRVETSHSLRARPWLDHAPAQPVVRLTVADNGEGIAENLRERIFEPFFSMRLGAGTGLGLAICQGIVKEHDGWIEVGEAPEGGAQFDVYLPAAPGGGLELVSSADAAADRDTTTT